MNECLSCGFWDSDREGCTCPDIEMGYACPLENKLEEEKEEKEEKELP